MRRTIFFYVLFLAFARTASAASGGCHRYIVAPPTHADEAVSDVVAKQWISSRKAALSDCASIVGFEAAKDAWRLLSISHDAAPPKVGLSEEQRQRVVELTRATALVILHFKLRARQAEIRPEVFRLKTGATAPRDPLSKPGTIKLPKDGFSPADLPSRPILGLLHLIPNAAMFGATGAELFNSRVDKGQVKENSVRDHDALPAFVSSFAVTNLAHPYSMSQWDLSARWYGSVAIVDADKTYELTVDDAPLRYRLSLLMVVPTVGGGLNLHTPLGTTFLNLGLGGGLYTYHDNLGASKSGIASVLQVMFGHTVFMTDRWFLRIAYNLLMPDGAAIQTKVFQLQEYGYAILGVGYFFPEVSSLARQVI